MSLPNKTRVKSLGGRRAANHSLLRRRYSSRVTSFAINWCNCKCKKTVLDDLRSEQQVIGATAKQTHELVLDSRVAQTQGREDLNSLARTVGRNEKQINELGQQVSSMMLDLRRVKTKVGLY